MSRDVELAEWTRRYVTEHSGFAVAGFEDGPVWTGLAPAVPVPAPEVTLASTSRCAPHTRGPLRIAANDQTYGLADVPGFQPRAPDLAPRHSDSDTVVVAQTYEF